MCVDIRKYFPYQNFREGQEKLSREICRSLKRGGITLIEASNGMGKTSAILTAILYLAREKDMRFLYLARTHRQIDRVMEECRNFKELKLIAFRGKKEVCLNWKARSIDDHFAFNAKCNELKEKGLCPFYKNTLNASIISNKCEDPLKQKDRLCPYYYTLKLLREGKYHAVILSYAYLLDPELRENLRSVLHGRNLSLIVDEAHNLKKYWIHNSLRKISLVKVRDLFREAACDKANELISLFLRSGLSSVEIPREYLRSIIRDCNTNENTSWIIKVLLSELSKEIALSWKIILTRESILIIYYLKDILEGFLSEYNSSVLISGTWGGEESKYEFLRDVRYFKVPIPEWGDVTVLLLKDFTTRFEKRNRSEYYRLATVIADLSKKVIGNIGIFAASYGILYGLLDVGFEYLIEKDLFIEKRGMSMKENLLMVSRYKKKCKEGAILLGVQGGRNSEGEDFPRLQMTTSIVIGLQLLKPGIESELFRLLWKRYSRLKNPDVLHGCRTAIQAAARPVRSPTDVGFIVLADRRLKICLRTAPKWISQRIRIVSLRDLPNLADEFFSSRYHLLKT